MSCGCKDKKRRSGIDGLNYVKGLANKFTILNEQDTEVYVDGMYDNDKIYNFSPIGTSNKEIIEIIKWQELEQKI